METKVFAWFMCVLVIAIGANLLLNHFKSSCIPSDHSQTVLAVGILSSRDHFEQREVIRETWLNNIQLNKDVKAWFVVGSHGCDIHPLNRVDQYGCHPRMTVPPYPKQAVPVMSIPEDAQSLHYASNVDTFVFRTLHSISVKRLGVHMMVDLENPVMVSLYDCSSEHPVRSVTFSQIDSGFVMHGFRYQPIETVVLPEGFEGFIKIMETYKVEKYDHKNISVNLLGGVIEQLIFVEHCFRDTDILPPPKSLGSDIYLVSMISIIENLDKLRDHTEKIQLIDQHWLGEEKMISEKLAQEASKHGDLLFVDIVDIYRHLPLKLLKFHEWLSKNIIADFVLKTDDDCYVNLEIILQTLAKFSGSMSVEKLWLGNFRNDWFVETRGKWSEPKYTAVVYPRFACGSGNIVSHDVHRWISRNADELNSYQGEDVSMGIWMAAVGPTFVSDERWRCNQTCGIDSFTIPELSIDDIRTTWENRARCNNPCGCDE